MHKKFIIVACLLFGIISTAALAAGSSVARLSISSGTLLQCTGNVIEARFTSAAYNSAGGIISSFSVTHSYTTSNGGSTTQTGTLTSNVSHTFYLSSGSGDVSYADVSLVSGTASATARISCDGTVIIGGVIGEDDRMNYANGDLINVLYASRDSVKVYSVATDSTGVPEGSFGYDLFQPYLNNSPTENTYLGQVDYSRLYALTSGEFQIVVDDPVESKSYTTIFSAFPISGVYFR